MHFLTSDTCSFDLYLYAAHIAAPMTNPSNAPPKSTYCVPAATNDFIEIEFAAEVALVEVGLTEVLKVLPVEAATFGRLEVDVVDV